MLEGIIPSFSRVIVVAVFFTLLFGNVTTVLAQGGGADSGQAANPNTGNNPGNPNAPGYYPPATNAGNTTNTGGSGTGGGANGGLGETNGAANTPPPQTEETPSVVVGAANNASWYEVLFYYVVSGFGWLVAQFGFFLDYAIVNFIVGFGDKYNNQGLGFTIDHLWGTVRDIFNLTFIFGLVYIGFQIILGTNDHQAKRTIPLLILAALLINFSLFITKFVIDFSNIAATQIFNLFISKDSEYASISIGITNLTHLSTIFSYNPGDFGDSLIFLLGMMLILMVLAYVFLAGAIMITIRFVVLNIYLVFSPVMFLGWVFPGMASYTKQFWKGFLGQAFFAPAFLFMLYLSFMVVQKYNDGVSKHFADVFGTTFQTAAAGAASGQNAVPLEPLGGGDVIPFFAMTMIFFIASIVVARKIAFSGSDMAISLANTVQSKGQALAGGATFGMAARFGRNTVGAAAYAAKDSKFLNDNIYSKGRAGQSIKSVVAKTADNSFDVRRINGTGKKLDMGEGHKGGFATVLKEKKEADEKALKDLGTRDFDTYHKDLKSNMESAENEVSKIKAEVKKATEEGRGGDLQYLALKQAEAEMKYDTAKSVYDNKKKEWGPEQEYARQLNYIKAVENWESMQKKGWLGAGIIAATAAASPIGLAVGGSMAVSSFGYHSQTKKSAAAMRKEYGKDGSVKKKKVKEEESRKKAAAAFGEEKKAEPKEHKGGEHKTESTHKAPDHKHEPKDDPHHKPAAPH